MLGSNSDDWMNALSMGAASGQFLSMGAPAVGVRSFIKGAYHNRGDGLPRALSSAYMASRGAIRGVYDLSGWLMDVTRNRYPNQLQARDLGFLIGLGMPLMNVLPFYAGIRSWRAGRRMKGALSLAFGIGMTGYNVYNTMDLMRKALSIGAGMNFRTGGFSTRPSGGNADGNVGGDTGD